MSTVVLGGGLSGLSAAFYLSKHLPKSKITLIESSGRLGGWIRTEISQDGTIFEQGPRTVRPRGTAGCNTLELVEELGLQDQVVPILSNNPAARNRMIYCDGELRKLPASLVSLFKTQKPFSKPLIAYLSNDLLEKRKEMPDESIYDFATRRFGLDIAEYLISPLICGICAGNAKEVSVKFLMEDFFNYEQKYGSVITGVVRNIFKTDKNSPKYSGLALRPKTEGWSVYSLKNGMETLPKALENRLKERSAVDIILKEKCKEITIANNNVELYFEDGESYSSQNVISSISAQNLSKLIKKQHPHLAKLLNKIPSVTVGVVNLHFKGKLIKNEGFGFLVPPKENVPILGVIYDSCCFPNGENTVLTVMMGGYWFEERFGRNCTEEDLLKTALGQLGKILNIYDEPVRYKVNILRNCIPQYVVGHQENVRNIQSYIVENKLPLLLCGSSYFGVGVNDVILSAKQCVDQLL